MEKTWSHDMADLTVTVSERFSAFTSVRASIVAIKLCVTNGNRKSRRRIQLQPIQGKNETTGLY
jgi:hypothetical protein